MTSLEPRLLLEALSFIRRLPTATTRCSSSSGSGASWSPRRHRLAAERITDEESAGLRTLLDSIGPRPGGRGASGQRPGVPPADRGLLGELGTRLAARVDVRADHPGPSWRGLTQTGARARTLAGTAAVLDALAARARGGEAWATVRIDGAISGTPRSRDRLRIGQGPGSRAVIGVHPWEREIEQTLRGRRGYGPGNDRRAPGRGQRRPGRRARLLRRGRRRSPPCCATGTAA